MNKLQVVFYKRQVVCKQENVSYNYNFFQFRLRLFSTTETELNAIAALANMGFSNNPLNGNNIPAAIGIPIKL